MTFNPKYTITAQMLKNLAKIELVKQSLFQYIRFT